MPKSGFHMEFSRISHRFLTDFSRISHSFFLVLKRNWFQNLCFFYIFAKKKFTDLYIFIWKKTFSKFFLCASTWRGRNFCLKSRRIFNICCFLFLQQKKFTESFLIKYKKYLDRGIFDFVHQPLQMTRRNFCHMIFQLIF